VRYLRDLVVPPQGWIAETRRIIGMRADQLARRIGVTQSTVSQFEQAEANGTITLNSLRKAAAAMDCRLVYAFVPEESFEELVRARALVIARAQIGPVAHTMALEDQRTGEAEREELLADYADALARSLPRDLWDEDA
jgi:predicted DNA-binding mobile mystery protein A